MVRSTLFASLLVVLSSCSEQSSEPAQPITVSMVEGEVDGNRVTFAFWNVENLFDAEDDADNPGDDEFLPARKWTQDRYENKLDRLASVIAEISPHVVGLAEVENRATLEALVARPELASLGFEIRHRESSDHRGIDVALLHRAPVRLADGADAVVAHRFQERTRDILEVRLEVASHPLRVYVNHWPSRWGGVDETRPRRRQAARFLREQVLRHEGEDLLILGDFNDEPYDASLQDDLAAVRDRHAVLEYRKGNYLYNPSWRFYGQPSTGTYYYNRDWSWHVFDQAIVSKDLLVAPGLRLDETSLRIHGPDRLRDRHGRPDRFGRGGKDASRPTKGYSDHFPIVGELVW